ncbi:hypothetical protein CVT24_009910, partial [Panaeolus cyanescens]
HELISSLSTHPHLKRLDICQWIGAESGIPSADIPAFSDMLVRGGTGWLEKVTVFAPCSGSGSGSGSGSSGGGGVYEVVQVLEMRKKRDVVDRSESAGASASASASGSKSERGNGKGSGDSYASSSGSASGYGYDGYNYSRKRTRDTNPFRASLGSGRSRVSVVREDCDSSLGVEGDGSERLRETETEMGRDGEHGVNEREGEHGVNERQGDGERELVETYALGATKYGYQARRVLDFASVRWDEDVEMGVW